MDVKEHFYNDNPAHGPADALTTLPGVNYFFLGNGFIQAAVQVCTSGQGTPLGLLIMHPEKFGPKRNSLTFDQDSGLQSTWLRIFSRGKLLSPSPSQLKSCWKERVGIPALEVIWKGSPFFVSEVFYCPDRKRPWLVREVIIKNLSEKKYRVIIETGVKNQTLEKILEFGPGKAIRLCLEYEIKQKRQKSEVLARWGKAFHIYREAIAFWKSSANMHFFSPLLDHFFKASKYQLPSSVSKTGKLDGSIWQYNREWPRDQSMVATGLAMIGQFELAKTILSRNLNQFVSDEGDTIDSSCLRPPEECELDQNGLLLSALKTYVNWSGDRDILKKHWPKIQAAANFPLKKVFLHPQSGLVHNQREFWERHAAHGIEDGLELAHQVYVSLGLQAAAYLARLVGKENEATRWEKASAEIRKATLFNKKFGLVHKGYLIKRRKTRGGIQREISPKPDSKLPTGVPLFEEGPHYLNPDSSTALPIALEFINPKDKLASRTLAELEKLWNQRWTGGGYARYHVSSEPDSPGPWPFPSLFIARAYFEAGQDEKVWRILHWLSTVPGAKAGSWFEFYGPRPVPPYPQIGIVPWTWAEILIFLIHHLCGVRPEWKEILLRPRLLQGLEKMRASFRLRNILLSLSIRKARGKEKPVFFINGKSRPFQEGGLRLPLSEKDIKIEAILR